MNPIKFSKQRLEFEGYLESWNSNYWQTLQSMPIDSNTVIDIAFGNLSFITAGSGDILSIGGLEMTNEELKKV
ncbi:MAG: hypothetical protein LW832_01880, partial [Parachlamydia sp.]|nr:hypothetical protein [Parachlamydia sp.]